MTSVQQSNASEVPAVLEIHRTAFGKEDEAGLVQKLLDDPSAQPRLSLVAQHDGNLIGHVLFTKVHLQGEDVAASILCPLAVLPEHHGQGVGSALVREGLQQLRGSACDLVFVFGDPAYYGRFGFEQADFDRYPTPQPIPDAYRPGWMVQSLSEKYIDHWQGKVICADMLNDPKYWTD